MKHVPIFLVGAAAVALAAVALRTPDPTYVAPRPELETGGYVPTALPLQPPAGLQRVVLDVEGMCCTGCTAKLYRRLLAQQGVEQAAVAFERSRAEAFVHAGTDPVALATALSFDKYTALPAQGDLSR